MHRLLAITVSILLPALATSALAQEADLVLLNGKIWTGDPDRPAAQWLAVTDGKIVALGDGDGWREHAGDQTKRIDADRRRVLPGLVDAHVHLDGAADDLRALDLRPAESREDLLERLRAHSRTLAERQWLIGTRWSAESWPDQRPPNAEEIDEATGGRPAVLIRMDGHSILASRSALEKAGIDDEGPSDPPGGTIGRDESGRPTGAVYEQAMDLVTRHIVQPDVDFGELLVRAVAEANRYGVTSVGAMESRRTVQRLVELDRAGRLTLRVSASLSGGGDDVREWSPLLEWAVENRHPSPRVHVVGFKAYVDGSLGSRTAWMTEPYEDNHMAPDKAEDNAGFPLAMAADGELEELIVRGAMMRLQPAVHAIGDRANHELLNWFEKLPPRLRAELRPRVEHTQHLLPEDVKRFAELSVVASMQPYHKADDGRYAEQRLGPHRVKTSYAFRGLLDTGATLAFGSDWPVVSVNPFLGIHAAVTARTLDGRTFVPEQSISVEEALRAYTLGSAIAIGAADRVGMLREGMEADFVTLDRDILAVAAAEIPDTTVEMTILGGQTVHERR